MSNLHPHWQTTDEEEGEQPVRISISQSHVPRARRSPAALIGIVAFVGIGIVLFNGTDSLWGQVTPEVDIRITQTAVLPEKFDVRPGDEIVWKNESGIPHILTSETLRDESALPFESTAIFPNETFSFTVPSNTPMGSYAYESRTSPDIKGEIVVQNIMAAASSSVPASAPAQSSSVMSAPITSSSAAPIASSTAMQSSSSATQVPQQVETVGGIPQNPYTVGNTNGTIPPRQQNAAANVTQHRPVSQPSTGAGEWTLACIGAFSLWVVMKRAMRFS